MDDIDICAARVREYDNDRFLSTIFAPGDRRAALMALYAFNLELSKIRETVSEPLIGRMRLQFWRDAMDGIASGNPPAHEVARPLSEAVREYDLPLDEFAQIIDCREIDLDDVPPRDVDALKDYAVGTAGALVRLGVRALGEDPEAFTKTINAAGICIAFVGLARAIPHQAASGRVTLPTDLCHAAGLDPTYAMQWPEDADFKPIATPLLAEAEQQIDIVRSGPAIPRTFIPAFLPVSLSAFYLRRLRRYDCDPVAFLSAQPGVSRQLTVLWHAILGRI